MSHALHALPDTDRVPPSPHVAATTRMVELLLDRRLIGADALQRALALAARHEAGLSRILIARGMMTEAALLDLQAEVWSARRIDPAAAPPDPRLIDRLGAELCLTHALLPWRRAGGAVVVLTARPELFFRHQPLLTDRFGPVVMALAPEAAVQAGILALAGPALCRRAESRVPAPESCRDGGRGRALVWRRIWGTGWRRPGPLRLAALVALVAGIALAWLKPALLATGAHLLGQALPLAAAALATALASCAVLALLATSGLKGAALLALLCARIGRGRRARRSGPRPPPPSPPPGPLRALLLAPLRARLRGPPAPAPAPPPVIARLPCVSIIVPLYKERHIASRLLRRLSRIDYPPELLDILFAVEAEDTTTRDCLDRAVLPPWIRRVIVPPGRLKTKPRALNFALPLCRGAIVGIYDAEDAPEPDQIRRVVQRFHERDAGVACLQGVLDYYNARTNWLSRCFTIEYATWFRVLLPGLERLGLPIPLGGTTLFVRRGALEAVGAWDAHNVTEDADLGLRLARNGYRTEILPTVTHEEANCLPRKWIRQRSRWLKGYMLTWAVQMRTPRQLWRRLGPRRFLGMQALFLGMLTQFLLAPLLWSLWLLSLGLPLPFAVPGPLVGTLVALALVAEAVNLVAGCIAVSGPRHRFLIPWVPGMILYFPLATLAAYKAAWELLHRPFYWDKTTHGLPYDRRPMRGGGRLARLSRRLRQGT